MSDAYKDTKDRGAVLLSTLLLMAVMAALSVTIIADIRESILRTRQIEASAQMDWILRGAEDLAIDWLDNEGRGDQMKLQSLIRDHGSIEFPIDEGVLQLSVYDGQNCYNVNRIANNKKAAIETARLLRILDAFEIDPLAAQTLVAQIRDWVDTDGIPLAGGAEDFTYLNQTPPYRTPGTHMVDITELRALAGVNEELYGQVRPILCALPTIDPKPVNINTLDLNKAALLSAVFPGKDGLVVAKSILLDRPQSGYKSVKDILEREDVMDLNLRGVGTNAISTTTDLVWLHISIRYQSYSASEYILLDLNSASGVKLVSRRREI